MTMTFIFPYSYRFYGALLNENNKKKQTKPNPQQAK